MQPQAGRNSTSLLVRRPSCCNVASEEDTCVMCYHQDSAIAHPTLLSLTTANFFHNLAWVVAKLLYLDDFTEHLH